MNVAIIPARGNSVSIPNKNMRLLGGVPLIQKTITAAKLSNCFDYIAVTSESGPILRLATENKIMAIVRPEWLSQNHVQTAEVCLDALRQLQLANVNPDVVTILQPTSPFRTFEDIRLCSDRFSGWLNGYGDTIGTLLSVYKSYKYHWHSEEFDALPLYHNPQKRLGRQWEDDMGMYIETGSIYMVLAERFSREGTYRLPPYKIIPLPDENGIDLDSQDDWDKAEALLEKRHL